MKRNFIIKTAVSCVILSFACTGLYSSNAGYQSTLQVNHNAQQDSKLKLNSLSNIVSGVNIDIYSRKIEIAWDDLSGIVADFKGYYYAINKNPLYTVIKTDNFTDKTELSMQLDYGTYYIHIAAVDKAGKISRTKTNLINVAERKIIPDYLNIPVEPDKVEAVKNMIIKGDKTTDDQYNKSASMVAILPDKVIRAYQKYGLKIYIADDQAETIYKEQTGQDMSKISGLFYCAEEGPIIIFEYQNIGRTLFHELGHAADFLVGGGSYITMKYDFDAIYTEEKDKLFPRGYEAEKSSTIEFFAEAFQCCYMDKDLVRKRAPKTYAYIKKYIMN